MRSTAIVNQGHPVSGLRTAPSVGRAEPSGEFDVVVAGSPPPVCTAVGLLTPGQQPRIAEASPGILLRARVQEHRISRAWQVRAELLKISDELDY